MSATVKDPVCGMEVAPAQFETIYEGLHYAFCSEQCRQRFAANPHLYVGVPGEKAPGQKGVELLKRRRFQLDAPLDAPDSAVLTEALGAMMGVKAVEIGDGNTVAITYDLIQATADQLEAKMAEVGARLGEGWAERLRRGFVHYMEETEVGNLEVHPHHGHGHGHG
ncbi:MAG: YHS domain-containing protein [Thiobacillus sp.]|jgi:YHS domain-containing protein|uniref:YHS domain-containing protein n=1 Tax=Thiobacillus sp. TaxID=924 RepID=UPI00289625E0|nr:YHS domain-containing protein [Thiobacillus sp.]MDT3706232.1 YHS domain-containing protein [Thiobacillus sp.]